MGVISTSYTKTPQANDDKYAFDEDEIFAGPLALDVMSNDLGGKAKTLYSIDGQDYTELTDPDAVAQAPSGDHSKAGADIWMGADGKIYYDATPIEETINALGEGQHFEDTFVYAIRMGNGTISWATVTIDFVGQNDAVDIFAGDGDVATGMIGEDDASLTAQGTLTVVDPDTIDVVDLAVTSAASGNIVGAFDWDMMFSLAQGNDLAADGEAGNVAWSFDAGSADFNYLAEGEGITIVYTITATDMAEDGVTARGTSDSDTVTITITGANDGPTITGGDTSGAVAEDGTVSASGSLGFADVDFSDTHSVTFAPDGEGYLGSFSASLVTDTTGDVAGSLDWSFSVDNAAIQYLGAGDTLVQTYTVTVDDGHTGGTTTQVVTITITGENDAPEITGTVATLAGGTEDTGYTISAADLLQGWSDVDQGTTLSVANLTADYGSIASDGMGGWVFTPDANYNGPVVLHYDVVDGDGGSVPASLSFDLAAVNDAATFAGDQTGEVTEDGDETTGGTVIVSDVDGVGEQGVQPGTFNGTYGTLEIAATGAWTYTLSPGAPGLDTLDSGESDVEHFDLLSTDGTAFSIEITVNGNDEPSIGVTPPTTFTGTGDANDFDNSGSGLATNLTATVNADVLVGTSGNDVISGNNGADTVYGRAGDDTIHGNRQADTLYGQEGADSVYGDEQADTVYGGSGDDHIEGNAGADTLYGGSGADVLLGGDDNDVLIGGYGADTMTGGNGDDTFRMLSLLDTNDLITDFGANGDNDLIDLSALDSGNGGDGAFAFGGTTATAHGVWYVQDGANTVIYADTDGNTTTAEFMVTLQNYDSGAEALVAGNFVL